MKDVIDNVDKVVQPSKNGRVLENVQSINLPGL